MRKYSFRKQLSFWRKSALFSVLLALTALWLVFDFLFVPFGSRGETVKIPTCVGSYLDSIETPEWLTLKIEYRYDRESPVGLILAQTPAPNTYRKITPNSLRHELSLVVSLGEETVFLPEMIGRDAREVTAELRGMGLVVEERLLESPYRAGTVYATEPSAQSELPIGAKVVLSVSAGVPKKTVKVPDLIGLSRADALVALWLEQLSVREVIQEPSELPEGVVIRQSHLPGTLVTAGTAVTLYVSGGAAE